MGREMSTREVVDRMRVAVGVSSDAELARLLNVSASTPRAWVRRESVPQRYLAEVSARTNAAVDWLMTGEGDTKRKRRLELYLIPELLEIAIFSAEKTRESMDHLSEVTISQLAPLVEEEHDRVLRLFNEFKQAGLHEDAILKAIRRSYDMPEESRVIDWKTGEPVCSAGWATNSDPSSPISAYVRLTPLTTAESDASDAARPLLEEHKMRGPGAGNDADE